VIDEDQSDYLMYLLWLVYIIDLSKKQKIKSVK
ncbi:unnamed protein product, partial [marine sediment metagenome]